MYITMYIRACRNFLKSLLKGQSKVKKKKIQIKFQKSCNGPFKKDLIGNIYTLNALHENSLN